MDSKIKSIRIDTETWDNLATQAKEAKESTNAFVCNILRKKVKKLKEER